MPRPILTADRMRAAEQAAIEGGTSVETLMDRAGTALAEAVHRLAGTGDTLILCGPGNNGGDGYVAGRKLVERGHRVRVAALAPPASAACVAAASRWDGETVTFEQASPSPILVDCLFGTGLTHGLEATVSERLSDLAKSASSAIACDLPSGVGSDDGRCLSPVPAFDMTVTFGALKPAHRLMPALPSMGRVVLADIGIDASSTWFEIGRPEVPALAAAAHKYSRGYVAVLAGEMSGAASLAASAAARSGAGYVRVIGDGLFQGLPASVVVGGKLGLLADDGRIGSVLIGPGVGRGAGAKALLQAALDCGKPLVLDADALNELGANPTGMSDAILTPHAGEFARLFPGLDGTKPEMTLQAARNSGAIVVSKGPDTLVASPDGRLGFAPPAPSWLASAGTGDVLAGIISALRARGMDAFDAACAGVWIHGRAAELAGPLMIADDLISELPAVLA
ncbi:NAD(P)H-hydrate dehydratase [Sphingomonas rhizophila]|uniref:Bifunctional NAD(P)H-hydrate repair enzyme n=1 Tax=Sphingomonas rhizophila TaxID=2071607 RepID=A0A7G9SDE0_9SPHN|nr:NAD(P)H-hydrate dehydratase [Sphingomonas rhizophila]QNN65865.1 NAD(P)H-hydrate dehydratase [Sphingomonas rhizophila]